MQETQAQSLGQEDPLKEEMATYSSILGNPMDSIIFGQGIGVEEQGLENEVAVNGGLVRA